MKKVLYPFWTKIYILYTNYMLHSPIRDIISSSDILKIVLIAIATYLLCVMITYRKINIADYWSFARKYEKLCGWAILATALLLIIRWEAIYTHIGVSLFVILNTLSILSSLLDIEREKRRKEKIKKVREDDKRFI